MAKAYSVQAGLRAIERAMQTHGAMGFTNELGFAEAYHTIRAINVADGTNEILARTIFQRACSAATSTSETLPTDDLRPTTSNTSPTSGRTR